MAFVLSTGAILTIAVLMFAAYGVFAWLCGGRSAPSAPPAPAAGPPSWLTPVVLVGLVVFGLRGGMPAWLVIFGSIFAVVMLVKMNVLNFGDAPRPAPVPPPLPRDRGFPNATYHPTFAPPAPPRSGNRPVAFVVAVLLAVGLFALLYSARVDHNPAPRNLQMVVSESWHDAMREVHAELQQGMHEIKAGTHEAMQEVAAAAEDVKRTMQRIPPPVPTAPPVKIVVQNATVKAGGGHPPLPPAPAGDVSPAIPPTQPDRINKVLGRGGKKVVETSGRVKKAPKAQPVVDRTPAVRVDYNRTTQELAEFPVNDAPNGAYILLTNPNDREDGYREAYQRGLVLLKNHLFHEHPELLSQAESVNLPPLAWAETNGLVHRRHEPLEDGRHVLAVGANFSSKSVDLAYNYHLGCVRTREAAKGYFGGLLCLGGLGLLLRIGTGVRPTAPGPKA